MSASISVRDRARASGAGGKAIACAVVGASGYAGAELVSLLASHPEARLSRLAADGSAGRTWEELQPSRAHLFQGKVERFDPDALTGLDVVYLALPHGASAAAAERLHGRVGCVIDLSGDLRLSDAVTYRRWYGIEHPAPGLLGRAVYGLPELFGDELPGARLVACAGCYATAAQLAAAPALALGDAVGKSVVVSAMSGTTGAGRKAEVELSFSEVTGNLRSYRVGRHQHAPEIASGLSRVAGHSVGVTFVPHLVPIGRGIHATVVMDNQGGVTTPDLVRAFRSFFEGRQLVRVLDPAVRLPEVADVAGTSFCEMAPVADEAGRTIVVLCVIDNLLKGAAGQAVQVMNLVCGLPETCGLVPVTRMEACNA